VFRLDKVLDAQALGVLNEYLASAPWDDGRRTAGWQARSVKNNEQVHPEAAELPMMRGLVVDALMEHAVFEMAARPKTVVPPRFSRYVEGMAYGNHVDSPMIHGLRTDMSVSVFLSDPDSYEGGELIIETSNGTEAIKLPAGDAVLYPASAVHRVDPVRAGTRLVAVTWVRSYVRDSAARDILLDLDVARRSLFKRHGPSPEADLLSKSLANLLRRWTDD
jgi:PKHD-type hydroxylase